MRPVAAAVAVTTLFACQDVSSFPLSKGGGGGPGQGGGGGNGTHDSGAGDGFDFDANTINARACLTSDLRLQTTCDTTGAGGLTVMLGNAPAVTTNDDGTFTILQPQGTNLLYTITGTNIVTSIMAFGATNLIPVIDVNDFTAIESQSGVSPDPSSGNVFIAVTDSNGAALAGEVATASPQPQTILYDSQSDDVWNTDDTETHGIVWVANAPPGDTTVTVQPANQPTGGSGEGSGDGSATGITVGSNAITFVQLQTF